MTTEHEIAGLKRRVADVEQTLVEIRQRIAALEFQARNEVAVPPPAAAVVAVTEVAAPSPQSVASPMEVPPVLASEASEVRVAAEVGERGFLGPAAAAASVESWAAVQPLAPRVNPLREWLEPLQLWPPSGEDNAEVRLAAWWTTRLGALLAVIGVVFLGIYVSRDAAPWVRLTEIGAVTGGVLALGSWLERRLPKFGAVLFGAGLALAYFCAFAAYAVTPMKVIARPGVATVCELTVVAAIFGVAWLRGSQVVATMAVALGYVTAFLALRGGPAGFGPWAVLALGVAAVALRIARAWQAPSAVAMPLAWGFLATAVVTRAGGALMPVGAAWVWATLYFVLFFVRDWVVALRGEALGRLERTLQVTNSSLAFAVGLLATVEAGTGRLTEFYFGAAVVLLAATVAWQRTAAGGPLVPILACKTAGAVALGAIAAWDGHARSLVLLAQAFAMLVAARRSGVRGLKTATMVVAAVALAFFVGELRPEHAPFRATATGVEIVFLLAATGFVGAAQRWLGLGAMTTALASAILAAVAVGTRSTWAAGGWEPAVGVGLALALGGVAAALRAWLPAALLGGAVLLAAHADVWLTTAAVRGAGRLWANDAVLLAGAAVACGALARWRNADARRIANGVVTAVAAATFLAVCFKVFPATAALTIAAGVAAAAVGVAAVARDWPLVMLGSPLFALGYVLFAWHGARGPSGWHWVSALLGWLAAAWLAASPSRRETVRSPEAGRWASILFSALATVATLLAIRGVDIAQRPLVAGIAALAVAALTWRPALRPALEASWVLWLAILPDALRQGESAAVWLAFAGAWLPVVALSRMPSLAAHLEAPPVRRPWVVEIQVALATVLGLAAALDLDGVARLGGLGATAVAAILVGRWADVRAARLATWLVAAVAWVAAAEFAGSPTGRTSGVALAAVLATGAAIVLTPFALERDDSPEGRRRMRWLAGGAGLALCFFALARQRGAAADFATVGWGVAAAATFLAGLIARSRPHRLVGLAGLVLCVPRAFVVDLHSTLHRIAAFVALGAALLWVGFSYHRFRHLIVDDEKKL